MERRKRFFISTRLLFAGGVLLILSSLIQLCWRIPAFLTLFPLDVLLFSVSIPYAIGLIITVVGLAFVCNINKSFLKAFIFCCIVATFNFINFLPLSAQALLVISGFPLASLIINVLVILTYHYAIDGISWYFDVLGDKERSRLGQKIMWLYVLFIGLGCAMSWLPRFIPSIEEFLPMATALSVLEDVFLLTGYTIYVVYVGRSMNKDF